MKKLLSFFLLGFVPLLFPFSAEAHAFGQLYTLPVPIWLYVYGGGAVVLVSFLLIGFFLRQPTSGITYPTQALPFLSFLTHPTLVYVVKLVSILFFPLLIFAGFVGNSEPVLNFATVSVWIIFWLGFTYFVAIFGNLWEVVNPWKVLIESLETVTGKPVKGVKKYPVFLGVLPAFLFFYFFIQAELLGNGANPQLLSCMILGYSLITFLGMWLFGKETWLSHGEFLTVLYRLVSRCSILELEKNTFYLRPPFVGLLEVEDYSPKKNGSTSSAKQNSLTKKFSSESKNFSTLLHPTLILFILFMLSSTSFDGFRATQSWWDVYAIFLPLEPLFGTHGSQILQSFLLFLSPFFFLIFYVLTILFMKQLVKKSARFVELASIFIFSLIPIALVYHMAHYYTLLVIQGQSMLSLISDPLNRGWNLFGTVDYTVNPGILGANVVWNSQVFFIVVGHIAAVFVAHVIALRVFPRHKDAVVSQIPMLLLMVFYTMFGLWILSQPLRLGA